MKRVQIHGKITILKGALLVITVLHDHRPDIAIFEDLFNAINDFEQENKNLTYREIVKRKRVQKANGGTIYEASQYTILLEEKIVK